MHVFFSVVVLEESPRGSVRTNLKVLDLGPQVLVFFLALKPKSLSSDHKSLSFSLPLSPCPRTISPYPCSQTLSP